jgi:hypothetical protein
MGTVNVSSSDSAIGSESNAPLNAGVKASFDTAFGTETWQLTKGSAWPYAGPFDLFFDESRTSLIFDDYDPYDYER